MNAVSLRQVVTHALAEIGVDFTRFDGPRGRPRSTTWIGPERGLGIRHYASGRNVYVAQTRMAGRIRTVTIGSTAVITLAQATDVARRVMAHALVGHDPATNRQRARSAPRFDDFLKEYWTRWTPRWKSSTLERNLGYRRGYLDGAFPGVFVDELNEAHVVKWFNSVTDRGGPAAANRSLEILRHMLSKAESWGYRCENTNPCREVRQNRRVARERFLSVTELQRLGEVLARERAANEDVRSVAAVAITLLLLTGCRRGEVLGLQSQDVKGNRLKLRDSKTGPRTIWLGDEARAVIDTLSRSRNVPWLFWNRRLCRPIFQLQHHWEQFRAKAGLGDVRLHDLRHTFASHAAMGNETLPMIGHLLGHSKAKSTSRYAHLGDEHLLDAVEHIGRMVDRLLKA